MSAFSNRTFELVASVASRLPAMQIQDYRTIGKDKFAVLFTSSKTNVAFDQHDYSAALAEQTDNKLSIVADSLFYSPINDARSTTPLLTCIISANNEVVPYSDEELKKRGLTSVAGNVLEDEENTIWKIVSNGDNKHLVQVTKDDYSGLLAKRRQRAQMTASTQDAVAKAGDVFDVGFQDTDFVYFINPEIEAMDYGIAIKTSGGNNYVVSKSTKNPVQIEAHQVIEALGTTGYGLDLYNKRRELTAKTGGYKDYIEYLIDMYGKNSEYVKAWMKAIKESPRRVA